MKDYLYLIYKNAYEAKVPLDKGVFLALYIFKWHENKNVRRKNYA